MTAVDLPLTTRGRDNLGREAKGRAQRAENDDHVFAFQLAEPGSDVVLEDKVREALTALLDVVCLTRDGELLEPDGFVYHRDALAEASEVVPLRNQRDSSPPTGPGIPKATTKQEAVLHGGQEREEQHYDRAVLLRTEPRIEMFLRLSEIVNEIFDFDVEDDPDSSRLTCARIRDLGTWATDSAGDPYEVIACLTRNCNARCVFCYVHGNPADSTVRLNTASTSRAGQDARARLDWYRKGLRLPQPTFDLEETLLHPDILPTLAGIREAGETPISLTTNGQMLDTGLVAEFKRLEPLEITLSLNSANPSLRRELMGPQAQRGIEALRMLDDAEMRVATTLVAWPTVPLEDLQRTIEYADQFDVRVINVILGGYTRFFPNPPDMDVFGFWRTVVDAVAPLRQHLAHPLIIQPGIFADQVLNPGRAGRSEVVGISPHSPAAATSLRLGDQILSVGGEPVRARSHCQSLLALLRDTEVVRAWIQVEREGTVLDVDLPREGEAGYRYGPPTNDRFGIYLASSSLSLSSIRQVYDLVNEYQARNVVVFTSAIVEPQLNQMLVDCSPLCSVADAHIITAVPECQYYGGTIVLGDLLTVEDFVSAYHAHVEKHGRPDLVLVPSAPFNWGGWLRDIRGSSFFRLREALDVPCELVTANNFE